MPRYKITITAEIERTGPPEDAWIAMSHIGNGWESTEITGYDVEETDD